MERSEERFEELRRDLSKAEYQLGHVRDYLGEDVLDEHVEEVGRDLAEQFLTSIRGP